MFNWAPYRSWHERPPDHRPSREILSLDSRAGPPYSPYRTRSPRPHVWHRCAYQGLRAVAPVSARQDSRSRSCPHGAAHRSTRSRGRGPLGCDSNFQICSARGRTGKLRKKKYDSTGRTVMLRPDAAYLNTSPQYVAWLWSQRQAGILHLVDLKRAGHSPTRTELNIPSDDSALRRYTPDAIVSAVGSPSEWVTRS
jgi:hypothetical protein